jgi:hypothetical protein
LKNYIIDEGTFYHKQRVQMLSTCLTNISLGR